MQALLIDEFYYIINSWTLGYFNWKSNIFEYTIKLIQYICISCNHISCQKDRVPVWKGNNQERLVNSFRYDSISSSMPNKKVSSFVMKKSFEFQLLKNSCLSSKLCHRWDTRAILIILIAYYERWITYLQFVMNINQKPSLFGWILNF